MSRRQPLRKLPLRTSSGVREGAWAPAPRLVDYHWTRHHHPPSLGICDVGSDWRTMEADYVCAKWEAAPEQMRHGPVLRCGVYESRLCAITAGRGPADECSLCRMGG